MNKSAPHPANITTPSGGTWDDISKRLDQIIEDFVTKNGGYENKKVVECERHGPVRGCLDRQDESIGGQLTPRPDHWMRVFLAFHSKAENKR